jgi:hypothetical protein
MVWNDVAQWVAVLLVVAAIILLPRWLSVRSRAVTGVILIALGSGGVWVGLALADQPIMQSEAAVSLWLGACAVALVLGIVLLVPLLTGSLVKRLVPSRRKEVWRAGHWKG